LAALEAKYPDASAPSGVPILPLAELLRLRLESDAANLPARAEALVAAALRTHPSFLTPSLIAAAASLLKSRGIAVPALARAPDQWQEDERARRARHLHEEEIDRARKPLWVTNTGDDGLTWWVDRGEHGPILFHSLDDLRSNAAAMAARLKALLPAYAAPQVSLDGVPLLDAGGEILATREIEGLTLNVALAFPGRLYAEQRRQTFWLAALLACALAAALAGFWAMRRALDRERQLGQLKSDFVSSVSHELRAPVASIRLMAENLEHGAVTAEKRRGEYHHLIAEECRRLSALIDNVLDFARIEQNRKTYDFAETGVVALVRDGIEFMHPRAAQRGQKILSDLQVIDPPPMCDGLAIRQALINLLDNAIKFSPDATAIHVRLAPQDSTHWKIAVRDEGPGIPAAEHQAIFERFYRLGSELRRETQGAGIGLNIVRHIAETHAGCVTVASQPGAGAEFTLILPMIPAGVREPE
jgi:signal transduction histidine kinase